MANSYYNSRDLRQLLDLLDEKGLGDFTVFNVTMSMDPFMCGITLAHLRNEQERRKETPCEVSIEECNAQIEALRRGE